LFNEGGDRDKLGRGWVWNGEIDGCIHQNHVFRARPVLRDVSPRLVSWWGNTNGQRYFFDEGKHTTNLASISLGKLRALPVALAPANEQRRIEVEIDRLLSIADEATDLIRNTRARCDGLRGATLRSAFAGRLVDQDPTDEPAGVLLDRIRAERAAKDGEAARRPRRRKEPSR